MSAGSNAVAVANLGAEFPQDRAVRPGSVIRVVKAFGPGKSVTEYAIVLTVAAQSGKEPPPLTIAMLRAGVSSALLGSGNWHQAFDRIPNVYHASHADVIAGKRGIYWVDAAPADAGVGLPSGLPAIEGGESTVYSRESADAFMERQKVSEVPRKVAPAPAHASGTSQAVTTGDPSDPGAPPSPPPSIHAETHPTGTSPTSEPNAPEEPAPQSSVVTNETETAANHG